MVETQDALLVTLNRLEKSLEDGVSRIEGRIGALETEVKHVREDSIRQDERIRVAQERLNGFNRLHDTVEGLKRDRARVLGFATGAGGIAGAILTLLTKLLPG